MKGATLPDLRADLFSGKKKEINEFSLRVLEVIKEEWPTNPLEVARIFNDNGNMKALSAKYLYHFRKLKKLELVDMKKIGNTYVAWPVDIEKLRVLHEMMR